ncbi:GGDEF domain-containing protein [Piscinibacter defluvii]|uniref:GGDEF domain-containing protein n=1 Tax=Piscinibacter defluvii TaxID=1796922 RepID=UPI0013E3C9FE|nr:GGDEF domain-containing protein [Piscinibacter defluvii]
MDPVTLVIVLAINLVCVGGLFHLIGRGMPPRSGLQHWSAGAVLFGCAYVARLAAGLSNPQAWMLLLDAAMLLAALLFIGGLRRFLGRAAPTATQLAALIVGFLLAQGAMVAAAGQGGRYALLNLALGLAYAVLVIDNLRALSREGRPLRAPLIVLTLVMGLLAALTVVRGVHIAQRGVEVMYRGGFAQAYYVYASLAAVLLGLNLLWMVFVRLHRQLAELASRDALTRVLNRNGLDEVLARHFAARSVQPLTLLQVDIDHFKRINDEHGHAAGDAALHAVAQALARAVRGSDFVARVGGEEFLVGCVGGDAGTAAALAERLRDAVRSLALPTPDGRAPMRCTVSVGISQPCTSRAGWDAAWREADRALYAAKRAGRDRVLSAQPPGAQGASMPA